VPTNSAARKRKPEQAYFNIFRIMLPKGAEILRADQLAKSAIKANQYALPSVQVLSNEDLTRILVD
jgi:hypothetical protein